jgi:hypothetical protein
LNQAGALNVRMPLSLTWIGYRDGAVPRRIKGSDCPLLHKVIERWITQASVQSGRDYLRA